MKENDGYLTTFLYRSDIYLFDSSVILRNLAKFSLFLWLMNLHSIYIYNFLSDNLFPISLVRRWTLLSFFSIAMCHWFCWAYYIMLLIAWFIYFNFSLIVFYVAKFGAIYIVITNERFSSIIDYVRAVNLPCLKENFDEIVF